MWSNAAPCWLVIMLDMFARDQMQLRACAWPSWRLLVIKCNSMFALPGPVCPTVAIGFIKYKTCACICLYVGLFVVSFHRLGYRVAGLSLTTQLGRT